MASRTSNSHKSKSSNALTLLGVENLVRRPNWQWFVHRIGFGQGPRYDAHEVGFRKRKYRVPAGTEDGESNLT